MVVSFDDIEWAYIQYAQKWDKDVKEFPLEMTPDNFGGRHLELSQDGKMALVGTERGKETARRETYSLDELLYWIFESQAFSMGFSYELKNRHPTQDFRRIAFAKALEEIEKLKPEWRDRLKQEQDEILSRNPYNDKSADFPKPLV